MVDPDPARPVRDVNFFFRLAAAGAALFILTVLLLVAAVFNDQRSPVLDAIEENGGLILAIEVGATLSLAFIAMTLDRRKALKQLAKAEEERLFGKREEGGGSAADESHLPHGES